MCTGPADASRNKSDIIYLKTQPGPFPVQHTQLSSGQGNCSCRTTNYTNYATVGILQKLISNRMLYSENADSKVLLCTLRDPVSSYASQKHDIYGCLPNFRHLGNTLLSSFGVAWPENETIQVVLCTATVALYSAQPHNYYSMKANSSGCTGIQKYWWNYGATKSLVEVSWLPTTAPH